jgi:hypothetical protein
MRAGRPAILRVIQTPAAFKADPGGDTGWKVYFYGTANAHDSDWRGLNKRYKPVPGQPMRGQGKADAIAFGESLFCCYLTAREAWPRSDASHFGEEASARTCWDSRVEWDDPCPVCHLRKAYDDEQRRRRFRYSDVHGVFPHWPSHITEDLKVIITSQE